MKKTLCSDTAGCIDNCRTCDDGHPHDILMTEMIAEGSHPLDAIYEELKAEYSRSLQLHPPAEWAAMNHFDMFKARLAEEEEFNDARTIGDITGPHGTIAESLQCAITWLRTYSELKRRAG